MSGSSKNPTFDHMVKRCVVELFSAYEVPLMPLAPPYPRAAMGAECTYMGLIGFTGGEVRGTVLLAPTPAALQASRWRTPAEMRGWVGELANQLLGRIKNQLLQCGVEIFATTPIAISGQHLRPVASDQVQPYIFEASSGSVSVWVDMEGVEELRLDPLVGVEHHQEGEAIEF